MGTRFLGPHSARAAARLLTPRPIQRTAFQVRDGDDADLVRFLAINDTIRKTAGKPAPKSPGDDGTRFGVIANSRDAAFHLVQECMRKVSIYPAVVLSRFIQFALGDWMEPQANTHLSLE